LIGRGTIVLVKLLDRPQPNAHSQAASLAPVTVRLATATDDAAIARVAGRDTRPAPPAPHLVAERAGTIEAVLSLATGEWVADPFRRTAEVVELLRCYARRHRRESGQRPRRGTRMPESRRLDLGLAGAGGGR
jgi:hypothetical protein